MIRHLRRRVGCTAAVRELERSVVSEDGTLGHSGSEQIGVDQRRAGFVSGLEFRRALAEPRLCALFQAVGEKGINLKRFVVAANRLSYYEG
jgi:hypothetical protein